MVRLTLVTSALSLLALGGCTAGEECDSGTKAGDSGCVAEDTETDADTDADTDSDTDADTSVSTNWSGTGLDLVITNGLSGGYFFGMADTRPGDGFTGEDCIDGNESDALAYGYDYCHSAAANGGSWTSICLAAECNPGEAEYQADQGVMYTIFDDTTAGAGVITYILNAMDGSGCWVWGDDVAYYDAYGCTDITGG